jgi:cation:H+ antiporter
MDILFLLIGLGILIVGGEFLVRGAVGLSSAFKISPMIIGLTVVSFGTSAPELLVSIQSAMAGNPGIAVGNVVGSNIANLALVLGITVIIFPIIAEKQTKMLDYPVMIFATLLFYVLALNLSIGFWEGLLFVILLLSFIYYLILKTRKQKRISVTIKEEDSLIDPDIKPVSLKLSIMFLLLGLIGLYFGSEWFVGGAVGIAKSLDLSDSVIGVTVVAFGTSAPELVASIMAAIKKQSDISVGNLVGSNIFNVFAVLGITGMVKPIEIEQSVMDFDMLWMIGISLLLIPILYFGDNISRTKGFVLFTCYILYISTLVLKIKGVL